jgi:hypothetical protein
LPSCIFPIRRTVRLLPSGEISTFTVCSILPFKILLLQEEAVSEDHGAATGTCTIETLDLNGRLLMSATGTVSGTLVSVDPDDAYPQQRLLIRADLKSAGHNGAQNAFNPFGGYYARQFARRQATAAYLLHHP